MLIKNTKILLKCFKYGFFQKHKEDAIGFLTIGIILITGWILFGIFGYINQNNFILVVFNTFAICIGTIGIMILLYFLKNINHIEREFKEKSILRRKLNRLLETYQIQIDESEKFKNQVTVMADNIEGLGMWIKTYDKIKHRFEFSFADKTMRQELFNNLNIENIVGKTYSELAIGKGCNFKLPNNFTENDIPFIDLEIAYGIGDITDEITRQLKKSCRFYQTFKGTIYDVWKTPLINKDNEVIGIVGALSNISEITKDNIQMTDLIKEIEAYQIDSTNNYYIKRYNFHTRCIWCPLNKPEKIKN